MASISIDELIKNTLEELSETKPGPHRKDLERRLKKLNRKRKKRKQTWQHSKQN